MSEMEIYGVRPNGDVTRAFELPNAWLGAALVWTELGNKYLGPYDPRTELERLRREGKEESFDPFGWVRTWDLADSPKLTDAEWCVLTTTFDHFIVPKEQFEYVAKCFEEFHKEFPKSHYHKLAYLISKFDALGYIGYCVNATSVNANPWWVREGDEGRPYNIYKDNTHIFFDPAVRVDVCRPPEPEVEGNGKAS